MDNNDIKKALECCTKGSCAQCPQFKRVPCQIPLMKNALALITSQEQRIKELAAKVAKWEEECDLRGDMWCKLNEENKKLTEENARLKGRNEHLAECLDMEDKYKDRLQGILLQFTDIVHKWGNKNGYDTSEISLVPVIYEANTIKSQIVADTVSELQTRFAMHYGTYTDKDMTPITEVFRLLDQIAKEMLEVSNE